VQEWFICDADSRVLISNRRLQSGQIVLGDMGGLAPSHENSYNAAGNRHWTASAPRHAMRWIWRLGRPTMVSRRRSGIPPLAHIHACTPEVNAHNTMMHMITT